MRGRDGVRRSRPCIVKGCNKPSRPGMRFCQACTSKRLKGLTTIQDAVDVLNEKDLAEEE